MSAYIDTESIAHSARRMQEAADRMERAADKAEEAARRIALMLEDGYGGNGLRLIDLLESAKGGIQP